MTRSEIIEAKPHHVGQVLRRMRDGHKDAVRLAGLDSHKELAGIFNASSYRKAWIVDGRLVALGGIAGGMLDPLGYVWLVVTNEITKAPARVAREAKRQLTNAMKTRVELVTLIIENDGPAIRLAQFLGFEIGGSEDGIARGFRRATLMSKQIKAEA